MVGINTDVHGFCVHALRATAATNALAHNADIANGMPRDYSTFSPLDRIAIQNHAT